MADLISINIEVNTSSLVDAKKKLTAFQDQMGKTNSILGLSRALGSVERNVEELVNAQNKGRLSQNAFKQGLLEQRKALEAMGLSSAMAKQRVQELTLAIRNQAAAQAAAKAAAQAAAQAAALAAANQRAAQSYNQLRASMDPVFAAQMKMKQAHDTVRAALAAGIITRAQAAQSLIQYRQQLRTATAALQQQSLGLNRTAVLTQQAGYQFGDFFVQIQSGTSFMIAFGQQATQLVGTMAMLATSTKMIAIFSGVGILIALGTAVGAAMMKASGASDTLTTKLEKLDTSASKVKETLEILSSDENTLKFGNLANEIESMASAMERLDREGFGKGLLGVISKLEEASKAGFFEKLLVSLKELGKVALTPFGLSDFFDPSQFQFDQRKYEKLGFDMAKAQFDGYTKNLQALAEQGDFEGVVKEFDRLLKDATDNGAKVTDSGYQILDAMRKSAIAAAELAAELNGSADDQARKARDLIALENARVALQQAIGRLRSEEAQAYADTVDEANKLKESIGQAYLEALGLSQVPLEAGINGAAEAALLLANRLGISLDNATRLIQLAAQQNLEAMKFEFSSGGQALQKYGSRGAGVGAGMPVLGSDGNPLATPSVDNSGNGVGTGSAPRDPLADLMKRIELEKELLGTSEAYQEVMRAIQGSDKKYSDAAIQGAVARLEAINKEKEALQQMESLQQSIAETIGDGFMSMVDGTKTVKEAFRDMARDIIKQLYEVLVVQRLVNSVKSFLGGSGLFADGGAFSAGRQIQAYANGGVVGGPTYFPMSGGKTGLMGEAGPEAIMPLKRGKDGKLGVSVEGSSGSVNVVNNINVTGGSDPAAIRAEVAKLMPQITSATKSAVIDSRRRGGQMKAAFQ